MGGPAYWGWQYGSPSVFFSAILLSSCVTVGGGDTGAVSGSAGTSGNEGTVELTRCPQPVATVTAALDRVDGDVLVQVGLPRDPLPALRLIMQQSNCVQVVHRDVVFRTMQRERELAKSGELQDDSGFERGNMVAARYSILPEITFSENNAGGVGAGLAQVGSLFGMGGMIAGIAAGGLKFKEAQVLLTLVDNRSGVQLAVASGSGSGTSFGGLGGVLGSTSALAGGYSNTNEGKVVMAAMVDAMNALVPHLRAAVAQAAPRPQ